MRLKVLVAHLNSAAGGNPDLRLLYDAVAKAGEVEIEPYTASALFRQAWDIVHFYWPEWCVRRDLGTALTALDAARLLAVLRIAKSAGTKIVWTANNIRPHEGDRMGIIDRFTAVFSRMADQVIAHSQTALDQFQVEYPAIRDADHHVIPPGHYRGVYPDKKLSREQARESLGLPTEPTIALCLGTVRRYKNLIPLVRCYREITGPRSATFLLIAGSPLDQDYASQLKRECRGIRTVRLDLRYIPEEDIQHYLRSSNFVIVPSSFALNSGSAMLALSFDRPVILPHRGTFIEMQEALGDDWVHTYEGGIRARILWNAFETVQPDGRPALEKHYDWTMAGKRTLDAYTALVQKQR